MAEFQLAEHLHKCHYEIQQMPCEEFDKWFLYLEWKNKEAKKNAPKKGKGGGKNRVVL